MNELPPKFSPIEEFSRLAQIAVNRLIKGHGNYFGSGTLTAASTTTVKADPRASRNSIIVLSPTSTTAQAAGMWISAKAIGSFTITHATPGATPTFDYVVFGGE